MTYSSCIELQWVTVHRKNFLVFLVALVLIVSKGHALQSFRNGVIPRRLSVLGSELDLSVSERVTKIALTGCTESPNDLFPLKVMGPITCPCFLSYNVRPDVASQWDVFLIEGSRYAVWQNSSFQGDPPEYNRIYSYVNITSKAGSIGFRRNDTNVYLEGEYFLAFRARGQSKVCFQDDQNDFIDYFNVAVFESMPRACPVLVKNDLDVARIVGGVPVKEKHHAPAEFSWIASISLRDGTLLCGGSHIAPGYILTAAHCNVTSDLTQYEVRVGTLLGNKGPVRSIKRIWVHPEYRLLSEGAENDLAIFQLDSCDLPDEHGLIALNRDRDHPMPGQYVTVAGYGYTSEGWSALLNPDYLRRVDMAVWNSTACKRVFSTHNPASQICASIMAGGCDSCK